MRTLRLGKQNYLAGPIVYCLFLAERAFDLMLLQTKIDKIKIAFRHDLSPVKSKSNN